MKTISLIIIGIAFTSATIAQNYTSYFTGSPNNISTEAEGGMVLMGGATEHDNAMIWFLEHSGGGDIVVLRASGSDGYNDYMYSELGVNVNSVETIVCHNAAASEEPYIYQQLMNAEALWFAGGDQWDYVSYWKDTQIETAINYLINVKKVPVGGTSAGMAILSSIVNTAQNGSATSYDALNDPYNLDITLMKDGFIESPWLSGVITDTHYDNPDRQGRHVTFMARIMQDYADPLVYGIACNEYVAVCIENDGTASVYGDYPAYDEFAFFIQANCIMPNSPETCNSGFPLTWNRNMQALKVYKVPGTANGINTFQLSNWNTGSGGSWEDWWVENGVLQKNAIAAATECSSSTATYAESVVADIPLLYPNPTNDFINFDLNDVYSIKIYDIYSRQIFEKLNCKNEPINVSKLSPGCYFASIIVNHKIYNYKFLKE
jgi:cyanophycinase-like exopeptidase